MTQSDAHLRQQALNPQESFIVRAPAGSGKTELLIQRYLVLLGQAVKHPAEIIAITFTRKAAREMKARILTALEQAQANMPPKNEHQRLTQQLAHAALKKHPHLLKDIDHLKIQTIDALCRDLTEHSATSLATTLLQAELLNDPMPLYRTAAQHLLLQLEENSPISADLACLLKHVDNQAHTLIELIAKILAKREQWLSHLIYQSENLRSELEDALQCIIEDYLSKLKPLLSPIDQAQLILIAKKAGHYLQENDPENKLTYLSTLPEDLTYTIENQLHFEALAQLLLTQDNTWRKVLNKNQGFPAPSGAASAEEKEARIQLKNDFFNLIEQFKTIPDLENTWAALQSLPEPCYSDDQWQIIEALLHVLPLAVAYLRILFEEKEVVDFPEISMAALHALGQNEEPTELALQLDYYIKHFLIDEFQDTSSAQYRLLERLTAGWMAGDGRTLFLVGDPMQSIYRFRNAKVGLFLHIEKKGLGQLPLTPLHLHVNFRSQAGLVTWFNETFQRVFPHEADIGKGAVPFYAATPAKPSLNHPAVQLHLEEKDSHKALIATILQQRHDHPQRTMALLVHARTHLTDLLPALEHAQIPYQATAIKPLLQTSVVQDLIALTRALLYPLDRIAWLAVLHAPWCGLTFSELMEYTPTLPIWHQIQTQTHPQLALLKQAFLKSFAARHRSLSLRVEALWHALAGSAYHASTNDYQNTEFFFEVLTEFDTMGHLPYFEMLETRLQQEYASVKSLDPNPLHIMTLHKAKGLEFDTVFMPALHRPIRAEEPQLLLWEERINGQGKQQLILAPMKPKTEIRDRCYDFLRQEEACRKRLELSRLLYVGVTRAREALFLYADLPQDENGLKTPSAQSLLAQLIRNSAI